jgi:hypothetical protein
MSVPQGADGTSPTYKIKVTGGGLNLDREIDAATATEIVRLAMGGTPAPVTHSPTSQQKKRLTRSRPPKTNGDAPAKPKRRASGSPGLIKDLSLRPAGKTSFKDFAAEKQPQTHQQKQAVIVYWLRHEVGMSGGVSTDHVNTCYREMGWKRPNDLTNSLSVTAKKTGLARYVGQVEHPDHRSRRGRGQPRPAAAAQEVSPWPSSRRFSRRTCSRTCRSASGVT